MSLRGLKAKSSLPHPRNQDQLDTNKSVQPSSSSTDKTSGDRRKQPSAGGVTSSQSSQISEKKLDVICIPCNDVYTVSMFRKAMALASTNGMDPSLSEDPLKRVPYVPEDSFAFNWSRRSLLSLLGFQTDIDREYQADYMMYVCLDEDAGLARNKYLELISGFQVYGDAFLFKEKREGLDAEYVDMDEDFGRDSRSLANSNVLLRKLLNPNLQDGLSIRPYMRSLTSVDAVRLPCNPSAKNPICLVNIPLVDLNRKEKIREEVQTLPLKVPDLSSNAGQKSFDWIRRSAVKAPYMSDDYVMYMCLDKSTSLPLNQSLKTWSKSSPPNFYGDAYIFRVDFRTGFSSYAKYVHVGRDIVTDGGQIGGLGSYILEKVFHEIESPSEYQA